MLVCLKLWHPKKLDSLIVFTNACHHFPLAIAILGHPTCSDVSTLYIYILDVSSLSFRNMLGQFRFEPQEPQPIGCRGEMIFAGLCHRTLRWHDKKSAERPAA